MTVRELIEKLSEFPPDMRVTLWDPDTDWLMPIQVCFLPEEQPDRECDFAAITGDYNAEIEGHGPHRM